MNNDDAKLILLTIRRMVMEPYPDDIDPRYAFACKMITGIATEAIQAVQQDRPMHINNLGFKETILAHADALAGKADAPV